MISSEHLKPVWWTFLFTSGDLISHTSLVWSLVSFSIPYRGRDSFVKSQVSFRSSLFANLSQQMICHASKGRWRLMQQVKKEHTINYGHVNIFRWIWCNSFFKLLKEFQLCCFLHCSIHVAHWQWYQCQHVSKYLLHVNLCLQGMVEHFVTTSFRSKILDLLLLDRVLVGVWIILPVFDEAITYTETNCPNVV